MTPAASDIEKLISYGIADWAVTDREEIAILGVIQSDPTPDATVADLAKAGRFDALLNRVIRNRRQLIELLGGRLHSTTASTARNAVARLGQEWSWIFAVTNDLQNSLRALGSGRAFACAATPVSLSGPSGAPYSGSGATGTSPATLSIPVADQVRLLIGHHATTRLYSNPIPGSLPAYLAALTPQARLAQATTLLCQTIVSCVPGSYAGRMPSRSEIVALAGTRHRLDPNTLAAFILAEQRDQSRNEDAKDLIAATSIKRANTSIGLGQVVVSTARRHDLFADLLSTSTRGRLEHAQIARLLASDEFNTFAVARYIRHVADSAAALNPASLPATRTAFPGINMMAFSGDSSMWPADNLRALGSEYTSAPWDDRLSVGWGEFVFQAHRDIRAARVF